MGGARLCAAPRGRREWGWAPADDHKWREVGTGPQAAGTSDDVMRGSRGRRGGGPVRCSLMGRLIVRIVGPPNMHSAVFDLFKKIQTNLNLVPSKDGPTKLKKFQVKYVFEGNEIRNKFPYMNFLKFGVEFEVKFKESLRLEIQ
jgi:hypothetical protein